jgi:hypothetical protein
VGGCALTTQVVNIYIVVNLLDSKGIPCLSKSWLNFWRPLILWVNHKKYEIVGRWRECSIGGERHSKCYFHENTKMDTYARVVIHRTTLQTRLYLILYFCTESHWSELFPHGNRLRLRTMLLPFIVSLQVPVPPAKPTSCC